MPERGFDTGFWSDPFVQKLPEEGKLLFFYLNMNEHCNQAGLYRITPVTIAFETQLAQPDIPDLLKSLSPRVEWYPELSLVWVKDFLREQAKSPKFIIAAIKSLDTHRLPEEIRNAFETYNEELLHGVAPSEHISPTKRECVIIRDNFLCQYCAAEITSATDYEVDHIIPVARGGKENYLNLVTACRACNQKKLDKTPLEAGLRMPSPTPFHGAQATYILKNNAIVREKWLRLFPDRYKVVESMLINIDQHYPMLLADTHARAVSVSVSSAGSSSGAEEGGRGEGGKPELAEEQAELLRLTRCLKHWRTDPDDGEWLQRFMQEFPEFDKSALTACADYHSGRSEPKHKGQWKNRLRNWMENKRKFAAERKDSGQRKGGQNGTGYKPPKPEGASKPGKTIDAEREAGAAD